MATDKTRKHAGVIDLARTAQEAAADGVAAWEEIEAGRYRPRRIRGSFPGRELG
jgi:hypothetical protein